MMFETSPLPAHPRLRTCAGTMSRVYTWLLQLGLVVTSSVDYVLYTRFNKQLQIYAFPIMQVVYPLVINMLVWPIAIANHIYQSRCAKSKGASRTPTIRFRRLWRPFLYVAILDTFSNVMQFLPLIYIPGETLVVFGQLHLISLFLWSKVYLGRRYHLTHYLGAVIVVVGVCVGIAPSFDAMPSMWDAYMGHDHGLPFNITVPTINISAPSMPTVTTADIPWTSLIWMGMLLLSHIPGGFSKVYLERLMKTPDLSPIHSLAGVALFQSILSVPMIFILLLPLPPPAFSVPIDELYDFFTDTALCFAGFPIGDSMPPLGNVSSVSNHAYGHGHMHHLQHVIQCQGVWVLGAVFILVNVAYNTISLALTKRTTANNAAVSSILKLGLSSIFFMIPPIAGVALSVITLMQALAIIILVLGVLVFYSRSEIIDVDRETTGDSEIELDELMRNDNKLEDSSTSNEGFDFDLDD